MDKDDVPLVVGLTYSLKKGIKSDVEDIEAEYDNIETIQAISRALKQAGCKTELLEADIGLFSKLNNTKADIIFNIAEGIYGRGREAQVPAILNYFKIPFAGSDETTLCISLDKALTKRILSTYKIKTPGYCIVKGPEDKIGSLKYPLIIKPNAEGSSKGISDFAIAEDLSRLKELTYKNLKMYGQPLLIEEFIQGREFTVGIVGNGDNTLIFSPMEIKFRNNEKRNSIYSYNVKKNYKDYIEYVCPSSIDKKLEDKMKNIAGKIYEVLECKDFSRIDFRLSENNEIYFIEINPLPGLAPGYSDYPMLAGFCGVNYDNLIKMILNSALKRYGMKTLK